MDVDAELTQRFSCLGTTDRDVLVAEFQRLLGFQLDPAGCAFFLDMSNWNLQAAIGAYYDFESPNVNAPSMSFMEDVTIGEGESVPPDTPFTKTWRIQNTGPDSTNPRPREETQSGPDVPGPVAHVHGHRALLRRTTSFREPRPHTPNAARCWKASYDDDDDLKESGGHEPAADYRRADPAGARIARGESFVSAAMEVRYYLLHDDSAPSLSAPRR
ncbi:hypothetical protein CRUP_013878 [Coryphaenoides rupestris]|nr:hypothetical protein CRUP_013878 [Coryphaenoides rupestris]